MRKSMIAIHDLDIINEDHDESELFTINTKSINLQNMRKS
jgi:hypothetical protein